MADTNLAADFAALLADSDVRADVIRLLSRDLTPERIAAYAAQSQSNSDRTEPDTQDASVRDESRTA